MKAHLRCCLVLALCGLAACDSLPSWMGGAEKEIARLPGEREDVLRSGSVLKPDEILQQVSFAIPSVVDNAAWTQATGQFTAATGNLALGADLTERDAVSVGGGHAFTHPLVPRPVVADGVVFAMDGAGYISAHALDNIQEIRWTSEALVKEDEELIGGGLAVEGGTLYATSGRGRVLALDAANGAVRWHYDVGMPLRSAPCVARGTVYVVTIDNQLYALNAATGAVLWTHRGIGETAGIMNAVTPTVAADSVIVPYSSGELYALRAGSGDEIWRGSLAQTRRTEATAIFSGIGGDPVVDDAAVFAVSSSGLFSAFNLMNGQPLWEAKLAGINTPWLVGEYVFLVTEDAQLVAFVKYDGRIRWTTQLKQYGDEARKLDPVIWRGPVMANGQLLLLSNDGQMLRLDPATGQTMSRVDIPEGVTMGPVVASGRLLFVTKDAQLYSYRAGQ